MRELLKTGETEKSAGALDRVDDPKDVLQQGRIFRVLLEAHEFRIEEAQIFQRLAEEFLQKVVHLGIPLSISI